MTPPRCTPESRSTPLASRAAHWLASLAAVGVLASAVQAQRITLPSAGTVLQRTGQIVTDSRTRNWDLGSFGTSSFGGSLGASANATRTYLSVLPSLPNHKSSAELHSDVTFFGNTREAARLQASAVNEPYTLSTSSATPILNYKPNTTIFLRLAGSTVWSQSYAATSLSKTWSANLGPYNTPPFSRSFAVLGIPVVVSASATAGAGVSLTATADLASVSLHLAGNANATARGSASAGFGFGFASAGLTSSLDLGNPRVEPTLTADVYNGISGNVRICSGAINLAVQLYAQISLFWGKIKKSVLMDLVNWSRAETCTTYTF